MFGCLAAGLGRLALTLTLTAGLAAAASAQDILIEQPFARATASGATTGEVYFVMRNTTEDADRLIGAGTDAAESIALRAVAFENGAMVAKPVPAIGVPAGGRVALRPGGQHVALVGLSAPLVEGATVRITLAFDRAGTLEIAVPVAGPEARNAP